MDAFVCAKGKVAGKQSQKASATIGVKIDEDVAELDCTQKGSDPMHGSPRIPIKPISQIEKIFEQFRIPKADGRKARRREENPCLGVVQPSAKSDTRTALRPPVKCLRKD